MEVAQRFCRCSYKGYALDENAGFWVCGGCGFPSELYYINHRASQPPGVPIVYAEGDYPSTKSSATPVTQRATARPRS